MSFIETQKIIDQQWNINHSLLNELKVLKYQPRIYLNAYISQVELDGQNSVLESIQKQIFLNEKLQEELFFLNLHDVHSRAHCLYN